LDADGDLVGISPAEHCLVRNAPLAEKTGRLAESKHVVPPARASGKRSAKCDATVICPGGIRGVLRRCQGRLHYRSAAWRYNSMKERSASMTNAILTVPEPRNEPMLSYAPGTPERRALAAQLQAMAGEVIEIAPRIGGRSVATGKTAEAVMPHDHRHVL